MNSEHRLSPMLPNAWRSRWKTLVVALPFVLLIPGFALADAPSPTPVITPQQEVAEGKISVDATAHKRVPNTVADVTLAIQLDGRTVDAVSDLLAQRSQTLLDFLRQQSVERLRTEGVTFAPQTEPVRDAPDRVVGFIGQAFVSFRTTPEKLGALLSGSFEHGANTVSQTNFVPLESEIDAARRDLAIEATKSALDRADAIAQSVGEHVTRIESIDVGSEEGLRPTPFAAAKAMSLSSAPTPIAVAAGEQDISVRVAVQVAISR
jgi:uncharacterized protein